MMALSNVIAVSPGGKVLRYLMKRLVLLVGIVFVISVGSFYLIHLLPGNPATVILGFGATPEAKAILYKQLGLSKPIYLQYFVWLGNILHGNLGISFISQTTVSSVIRSALPIDVEIIVISQILAFAAAIPIAMRSARKPDGIVDRILGRRELHPAFDPSLHLDRRPGATSSRSSWGVSATGPSAYVSSARTGSPT